MAGEVARDNDFVMDLDARFADLVAQRRLPRLVGLDAFENKFIIPSRIWNTEYVVSAVDSASYFGAFKIVPKSDHFSIAKPTSVSHPSHQLLWDFFETRFRPLASTGVDFATSPSQVASLLKLLQERAEWIQSEFDKFIEKLNSRNKNKEVKQLKELKAHFLSLHGKHLAAIRYGDQILAHEINRKIQDVLVQARGIVRRAIKGEMKGDYMM